jgi:YVTN family beta-propeller protein
MKTKTSAPDLYAGRRVRNAACIWLVSAWSAVAVASGNQSLNAGAADSLPVNKVVATISDSSGPGAMVVSSDSDFVYVANIATSTISVIKTANNTISATLDTANPSALVVTPDGSTLYVLNNDQATVSVLATSNGALLQTITLGGTPNAMAISPDGSQIYVTDYNAGTVAVIDTSTNQVSANKINVGGTPVSVAFSSNGTYAYVGNLAGAGFMSSIETSSQDILSSELGAGEVFGSSNFCINPSGSNLYVCDIGTYVDTVDISTQGVTKTCLLGAETDLLVLGQPAVTPSGKYLYVPIEVNTTTGETQSTVVMIDTSTGKTAGEPITVGSAPSFVAITPKGNYAYVSNLDSVSVIDISQ